MKRAILAGLLVLACGEGATQPPTDEPRSPVPTASNAHAASDRSDGPMPTPSTDTHQIAVTHIGHAITKLLTLTADQDVYLWFRDQGDWMTSYAPLEHDPVLEDYYIALADGLDDALHSTDPTDSVAIVVAAAHDIEGVVYPGR